MFGFHFHACLDHFSKMQVCWEIPFRWEAKIGQRATLFLSILSISFRGVIMGDLLGGKINVVPFGCEFQFYIFWVSHGFRREMTKHNLKKAHSSVFYWKMVWYLPIFLFSLNFHYKALDPNTNIRATIAKDQFYVKRCLVKKKT